MKIVNIIGGLGNQMFGYALAIALKNKNPQEDVLIDTTHFKKYKLHNGFEIFDVFGEKDIHIANPWQISRVSLYIPHYKLSRIIRRVFPKLPTEYREAYNKMWVYDEKVFDVKGNCYYDGYWQSNKYFEDIRPAILECFTLEAKDSSNLEIGQKIINTPSVGIHIRRGDYVGASMFKDICTMEYYQKAIRLVREKESNPHFFIFSNDAEWCRNNLKNEFADSPVYYVDINKGKDSWKDMALMSKCKHLIIANSSFSWWGAYLNKTEGLIIAPQKWVNVDYPCDIFRDNWVTI